MTIGGTTADPYLTYTGDYPNMSKYIRIETGTSVWGFINKSNNNFNPGDIFKPKNWKTPTLNRARGNILSGKYSIKWTGPLYLHDVAGKGYYSWADNEIAKRA